MFFIRESSHDSDQSDILFSERHKTQTLHTLLPRDKLVKMQPGAASVTTFSFYKWAEVLVESILHMVQDGRNVLFLFEGHRSHMHLQVLEYLNNHGVVVYALPHTLRERFSPAILAFFAD